MLSALYERGIAPDVLVAASVGALNAAFVASRPQTAATASELGTIWRRLRRAEVLPVSARTVAGRVTGRGDHLVAGRALRRLARRHLQLERLEDAPIPLHLVAFDLWRGHEVVLSAGPAVDAVLATTAVHGVLPAVPWGRRRLVDAAATNPAPIAHAVELFGAERVYVLHTCEDAHLRVEVAHYAREVELVVLPVPCGPGPGPADFGESDRLIGDALACARGALDGVGHSAVAA
jgi:NTE family protein